MSEIAAPLIPNVFPTIVVDREYGEILDDVNFDLGAITEYLRGLGVPDKEILSHTIHLRAESKMPEDDSSSASERMHTVGVYHPRKRLLEIYNQANEEYLDFMTNGLSDFMTEEGVRAGFANHAKREMYETALHELDHVGAQFDKPFQKQLKRYEAKLYSEKAKETGLRTIDIFQTAAASALTYLGISPVLEHITGEKGVAELVGGSIALSAMAITSLRRARMYKKALSAPSYDEYYNNPLEVRARAAQENDTQLLYIHWKPELLSLDNQS